MGGRRCGATKHLGKRAAVGRVLVERGQRKRAELRRRVRVEEMRAAIDGVDRLPIALAGMHASDSALAFVVDQGHAFRRRTRHQLPS